MQITLEPIEIRILGVLIEKQLSTPDYYPLTLNALVNACNQKSNRDPVMALDQPSVEAALARLRKQRLVWQVMTQGARTPKYEHNLKEMVDFSNLELAIMCELLLRGPQTLGELRSRIMRLAQSYELPAIENTLKKMMDYEGEAYVALIERRPGQKEPRYRHLLGRLEEPELQTISPPTTPCANAQSAAEETDRLERLEARMMEIHLELKALQEEFIQFKSQFE